MNFADRLDRSIRDSGSFICAGFDPQLEALPPFILERAGRCASTDEAVVYALTTFYTLVLDTLAGQVAAIKPNIAFFEQYGLAGLAALVRINELIRERGVPLIIDAKRGDIGSTAKAYSTAFLGRATPFGREVPGLTGDAVTVNPFLGFDTLEPFLADCAEYGRGIFVLVKTSNPGSGDIQGSSTTAGGSVSELVARWLHEHAAPLTGTCGFSGLGAVVGATYPEEGARLRTIMTKNFLLIPGMGAQGGTAADAIQSFGRTATGTPGGAIINLSRGLTGSWDASVTSAERLQEVLSERTGRFNSEIAAAVAASR